MCMGPGIHTLTLRAVQGNGKELFFPRDLGEESGAPGSGGDVSPPFFPRPRGTNQSFEQPSPSFRGLDPTWNTPCSRSPSRV